MLSDELSIEVDYGCVVDTPEPQHHPGVHPLVVHIELGVIPGPAHVVPVDQGVSFYRVSQKKGE